ncbi:MAG: YhbY family RNA-binding protein [Azoarcus sp.]|nr:YhbY family RNA-binding protein [Azoarcus sp.]
MIELSPSERRDLRARAHGLHPVVTIAGNGLSLGVIAELARALQAHELIKIRIQGAERARRDELMTEICAALDTAPVQHIGNILIVWRPRREEQDKNRPAAKPAPRAATAKSAAAFAAAARRAALVRAGQERRRSPRGRG